MEVGLKPGSGEQTGTAEYDRELFEEGNRIIELTEIELIHAAEGGNRRS